MDDLQYRVFLDANILFSASFPSSPMARFFHIIQPRCHLITSDYAIEEANKNLLKKKLSNLPYFEEIVTKTEIIEAYSPLELAFPNRPIADKDIPILLAAVEANADYLVTGDRKDFGHLYLKSVHSVTIVTPNQFTEILAEHEPH